jgi:nicotinamidase-related amidase
VAKVKTTTWEDHSAQLERLNAWISIDPSQTAVVTIDMHRGHLGGEDATMPVKPEIVEKVLAPSEKFLRFARDSGIPVIHAILTCDPRRHTGSTPG